MNQQAQTLTPQELLSRGLQDLKAQLHSYAERCELAVKCEVTINTLDTYLGGDVGLMKTGKKILTIGNKFVVRRDHNLPTNTQHT